MPALYFILSALISINLGLIYFNLSYDQPTIRQRNTQTIPEPLQPTFVFAEERLFSWETAEITAYSELDSCHYPNCIMSSGNKAYIGAIACPREIPLYTRVVIDNILYICEDRTSKKLNGRFDIFMGYGLENYEKAKQFGIKKSIVKIYKRT